MTNILASVVYSLPREWEDRYRADMALVELKKYSSKFLEIKSKMDANEPKRIYRVENPYLYAFYQLKKEECMKRQSSTVEREFWHVTSSHHIDSIATHNFDWRLSNRAKYGQGVCFSPDLDHALCFSTNKGAVILAQVLVGEKTDNAGYGTEIPPTSYDTTTGWRGNVYVKYMDNEFYPAYVVYL